METFKKFLQFLDPLEKEEIKYAISGIFKYKTFDEAKKQKEEWDIQNALKLIKKI
jgi:hypothetical protein